jgi:hypothetical protein
MFVSIMNLPQLQNFIVCSIEDLICAVLRFLEGLIVEFDHLSMTVFGYFVETSEVHLVSMEISKLVFQIVPVLIFHI